jgi:hypothetical protein
LNVIGGDGAGLVSAARSEHNANNASVRTGQVFMEGGAA